MEKNLTSGNVLQESLLLLHITLSDVDAFFDDASSDGTCHGSGILVLGGHLRDRVYDSAEENVQKYENQGEFIGQTPCIKRLQHHDIIEAAAPHLTRVVSAVSWNDDN